MQQLAKAALAPTQAGKVMRLRPARRLPGPAPLPGLTGLERGLVAHVSAYEDLALQAALHGGRERVFRALLAHPLVGQAELADDLTERMLAANREFLPWA